MWSSIFSGPRLWAFFACQIWAHSAWALLLSSYRSSCANSESEQCLNRFGLSLFLSNFKAEHMQLVSLYRWCRYRRLLDCAGIRGIEGLRMLKSVAHLLDGTSRPCLSIIYLTNMHLWGIVCIIILICHIWENESSIIIYGCIIAFLSRFLGLVYISTLEIST